MGRLLIRLATLFLVLAAICGVALVWGYAGFTRPGPLKTARVVVISPGIGLEGIARTLHQAEVIASPELFVVGVELIGAGRELKAGEFRFPDRASPREVMEILRSGKPVVRRITIVEGLTVAEVLERLEVAEGLVGTIETPPGEGSLLPETYHFSWGDTRDQILQRMQHGMRQVLDELWQERSAATPVRTPEEALILASIIEKETGIADERPLVAGVFANRLKLGMRLQSDPTVAYGIDPKGLDRPLSRADLDAPGPYNTYLNAGLPPTPIANPGRASIRAALNPAKTEFLYFVADGQGGHAFARTLVDHNRNVARWRRGLRGDSASD